MSCNRPVVHKEGQRCGSTPFAFMNSKTLKKMMHVLYAIKTQPVVTTRSAHLFHFLVIQVRGRKAIQFQGFCLTTLCVVCAGDSAQGESDVAGGHDQEAGRGNAQL